MLVLEEAVYYYCFLCSRFYNLRTGKEENLLASAYLVKFKGQEYLLLGRACKDIEALHDYFDEILPFDTQIEIKKLPVLETKKELVEKIIDNL